ncbi:hypothetical protein SmJEL517_g05646 [Synchytrium microbalum]|uniref:Uncharacterized protein n=1 Tax=Synchytrium microbalum TaxID=1806994 RepID=A0A507BVC4_9FUNG|nr:uncharacterized protein SmJEL517_g05646 [Synchytrium microbalum]TPX30899.1 hypothetical protein SmJEL517_g05646 [Synchytrium microbalum]
MMYLLNDEERRALLGGNREGALTAEGPSSPVTTQPRAFKQRELEALKKIVKRTAENLLKPEELSFPSHGPVSPLTNVKLTEILSRPGPTHEDSALMSSAVAQMSESIKAFKIDTPKDLILPLTLPQ